MHFAVLAAAGTLAVMAFAPRIPPNGDFILPNHPGIQVYRALWRLFSVSWGPIGFEIVAFGALIVCAAVFILALRRESRPWPKSWAARAGALAGPLFSAVLTLRLCGRTFDLVQYAWFPYGAMDIREPVVLFAFLALSMNAGAAATRAWAGGARRKASLLFLAMIVADLSAGFLTSWYGIGRSLELPRPKGRTIFIILTESPKGPDRTFYVLPPDVFSDQDSRPALKEIASRSHDARVFAALRALYSEETKRWNLPGLLEALLLGASRGDPLAPGLLAAHLSIATPSAAGVAALATLSDEKLWRIGPMGAAALARAYSHVGDQASARLWAMRADTVSGIAVGLQPLESERSLRGGISGVLRIHEDARIALYKKPDPMAPYMLDSAVLVAASDIDSRGRFSFNRLPMGRYYLAIAVSDGDGRRGEISVTGNKGDLIIDTRHPMLKISPITINFVPH